MNPLPSKAYAGAHEHAHMKRTGRCTDRECVYFFIGNNRLLLWPSCRFLVSTSQERCVRTENQRRFFLFCFSRHCKVRLLWCPGKGRSFCFVHKKWNSPTFVELTLQHRCMLCSLVPWRDEPFAWQGKAPWTTVLHHILVFINIQTFSQWKGIRSPQLPTCERCLGVSYNK